MAKEDRQEEIENAKELGGDLESSLISEDPKAATKKTPGGDKNAKDKNAPKEGAKDAASAGKKPAQKPAQKPAKKSNITADDDTDDDPAPVQHDTPTQA